MPKFLGLIAAISISLMASRSEADLVVAWDVNGVDVAAGVGGASATAPHTFSATSSDVNVSGALTLGSGVNPSTATSTYGFKIASAQNSLAGAIANNHYFQFSVNVGSGFKLDLSSIEMNGQSSGTGSNDVALFTSIDGFSVGDEIASLTARAGVTGGFDTDSTGFGGPIDLTDAIYQNLTGNVTFRLYGYNTSGSTGTTSLRNLSGNDLVVNGAVSVVPEPTSLLMFGTLVVSGLGFRRRK